MSQFDLTGRHHLDAIISERWTASDWNRWTPQVQYAWTASSESAVVVKTARLDDVYDGDVGFVKIDVEGHEEAVLEGARSTVARYRPRMLIEIEERHAPGAFARIVRFFTDQDYQGYFLYQGRLRPVWRFDHTAMQQPEDIARGGIYINNFIFLPEEDAEEVVARTSRSLLGRDSSDGW